VLVTDIQHRESLIDPHNPTAFQALRDGSGHPTRAGGEIENLLVALQREHIGQLLRQIVPDLRGPAIELRRMLRVVEARVAIVAVAVGMIVFVLVTVLVRVLMSMAVLMTVGVRLITVLVFVSGVVSVSRMFVIVLVSVFVFALIVFHCSSITFAFLLDCFTSLSPSLR
jgi:hypothetical protein